MPFFQLVPTSRRPLTARPDVRELIGAPDWAKATPVSRPRATKARRDEARASRSRPAELSFESLRAEMQAVGQARQSSSRVPVAVSQARK